ncbi:MAG: hypothetical protein WC179_05030 [Candidatus Cloacimonadaceae bacterium]
MRILRNLTDKEKDIIKTLIKKKELNCFNCSENGNYYGVDKQQNKEDIETIENILGNIIEGFGSFCNFTNDQIRFIANYNPIGNGYPFYGIVYMSLEDFNIGDK